MALRIYFAGSIRGGRTSGDRETYATLIECLRGYGTVLTEHVASPDVDGGEEGDNAWIYHRDMEWLESADVLVAEVSTPSLGVGYEIASAERLGKPVLCLFNGDPGKLSAMIAGNPRLNVRYYKDIADAKQHIASFFKALAEN